MQVLFNLKLPSHVDRSLLEIVVNHSLAAERLGPGGFNRCIELLLDRSQSALSTHGKLLSGHPTSDDIESLLREHTAHVPAVVGEMLRQAVSLAGFGGRVIVEKTCSTVPSVELVRGYTFDLQQLLPIDISVVHPRVFCIDGYVEEVAEIHHLLEAAAEAHEPCVLFLRGVSDDVKHTLKVNYDRGSLRVFPIGVRFDLTGMNSLADISLAAGCDLVSSLKGDLISSIRFHEAPRVDEVTSFRDQVVVMNSSTHARVAAHVNELRSRRADEKLEEKAVLLDKRIRSLTPNHVIVRLPAGRDFVISSQSIDYALRAVRSAVEHGVISDGKLMATELAASLHAERCWRELETLGAVITPGP